MNKRNFWRVIKRIEAHRELWRQGTPPNHAASISDAKGLPHSCGTPYCFLGHAEYLRTWRKQIHPRNVCVEDHPPLAKWLGLNEDQMYRVFDPCNTIDDFKRWHKAGKVS